jgi:hypothetical protein
VGKHDQDRHQRTADIQTGKGGTGMDKKYYSVNEAAQIMSIKPKRLREMCHAKGQRFAFQPVKCGNIQIDIKELEKWMKKYPA